MTSLSQLAPGVHLWAPEGHRTWGLANCGLISSGGDALLVDTPYSLDLTDEFLSAARSAMRQRSPDPHGCLDPWQR